MLVLGPGAERNYLLDYLNVLEACTSQEIRHLRRNIEAQGSAQSSKLGKPLESLGILAKRVIVTKEVGSAFGDLNSTARFAVVKALLKQARPVLDGAGQGPCVDEVEMVLGEHPLQRSIVDLKTHVWGYPAWGQSSSSIFTSLGCPRTNQTGLDSNLSR